MTLKTTGGGHRVNGTAHSQSNGQPAGPRTMPLAIVGMACRFGGDVTSPEKLWDLVSRGKDVWSEIPEERFNAKSFYHPDPTKISAIHATGGYFLKEDLGAFDVNFFNMSADLAAAMDPQLRLQLEVTFEALESAGIPLHKIAGSNTSVFTGSLGQDYKDVAGGDPIQTPRQLVMGNDYSMMANRISHFFDLRGHSTAIATACSTSLMGLHLACQSLRSGDSDAAIVGGAGLCLSPSLFSDISTTGLCGPDGKCFAFDHRAQGYGRGEGIGALVVKRLADAVRDGDPIRAVVRETGANQNGRNATITSPDTEAQRRLINRCYADAGLRPLETAMVEAHGTGTMVGDPREANAIGQTLGRDRPAGQPLLMASVKTNIGHTEGASGLASIIKAVMSFEHEQIAPSLNFEKANPNIDLERLNIEIPQTLRPWPRGSAPRRASVNNFGFGGTNTHVILEEAGPLSSLYGRTQSRGVGRDKGPGRLLFVLSAKDKLAAGQMTAQFRAFLERHAPSYDDDEESFADLAYTLAERRTRFPWTWTVSAAGAAELAASLADSARRPVQNAGTPPRLGFVFNGQGAQWFGMGRELMGAYPVYAKTLQECNRIIASFGAQWSLIDELGRDKASSRVDEVQFSMPISCAVQLALVELLREFGIQPAAATGHSSGEVAAAFAAGALTLREAMACTYFRGLINAEHIVAVPEGDAAAQGGMMAVGMAPADLAPYLDDDALVSGKVVMACINSPSSVTLSGDMAAIERLKGRFEKEGVFARTLKVQAAFHSHHMLPLQDRYLAALQDHLKADTGGAPRTLRENVLFVSPVTGERIDDAAKLGPQHWVDNMTQPVLFAPALERSIVGDGNEQQVDTIIEIGPHSALAGPIRQSLKALPALQGLDVGYGSCLERGQDAVQTMQTLAGFLVARGYPVDTCAVNFPGGMQGARAVATGLPSYPWNHSQRFWHETALAREHMGRRHPPHDLLGVRSPGLSDRSPVWRHVIRTAELPWVRDHVVQGDILYPAAGYIAMAIEGMRQMRHGQGGGDGDDSDDSGPVVCGYRLTDMDILRAVVVPDTAEGAEVQLFLEPASEGSLDPDKRRFRIYSLSRATQSWEEVVRGFVAVETAGLAPLASSGDGGSDSEYSGTMAPADLYSALNKLGVSHGPIFQNLADIRTGRDCSSATFRVTDTAALMPYGFQQPHVIHPITLDQVFQAAYSALSPELRTKVGAAVPRSIRSLYISADMGSGASAMTVRTKLLQENQQGFQVGSTVVPQKAASDGALAHAPVIQLDGMRYQSIGGAGGDGGAGASAAAWDICAFVDYEPSVALNDASVLVGRLKRSTDADEKSINKDLDQATYHLVADAVAQLSEEDVRHLQWHHQKLYAWIQLYIKQVANNEVAHRSARWPGVSPGIKAMLLDRVARSGPEGEMLVRVGQRLLDIFRAKVPPLDVMLEGDLLYRVYSESRYFRRCTEQLAGVVAELARERPRLRILEIGGGTGGGTEPVLQALGHTGFDHYDFTDISAGFFPRARERFAAWGDKISYRALNIEDDVAAQGFAEHSYDLVVAVQVLHATKNMKRTMGHVRRLLKDNGRLLMIETTQDWAALQLIFGILPSWWLSEEPERAMSPNLSVGSWGRVLEAAGFSGTDAHVWVSDAEQRQGLSLMVSTAAPRHTPTYSDNVALVYDFGHGHPDGTPPLPWLHDLAKSIGDIVGAPPAVGRLGSVDCRNKVCILVSNRSDGASAPAISFSATKQILTQSKGVFWVTTGATMECPAPDHAMALGILRTYRAEDTVHRFVSLDLDPDRAPWDALSRRTIARVFAASFDDSSASPPPEDFEFAERGGVVLVPRVRRDEAETARFVNEGGAPELQPYVVPGPDNGHGRQTRLEVAVPGKLESLVFRDDEAGRPLADGEVEVAPRAYGLHARDLASAMGRLDEAPHVGSECAGVVTRVGRHVDDVRAGDRVVALTAHGGIASRVRAPSTCVARVPDGMEFSVAAGSALVFTTAYYSLFEAARLECGESVLIHEAAGAVGQACVRLAQWRGLKVLATANTARQQAFLRAQYGIDHVFLCCDASFVAGVLAATGGRGVDAIINSLAGPLLQKTCGLLAPYGRLVDIAQGNRHEAKSLEMDMFRKAASFAAVDVMQLAIHRGRTLQRVLGQVMALLGSKTICPVEAIVEHSIGNVDVALQSMQEEDGSNSCHVVVPTPGDLVKILPGRETAILRDDATYLIIGGLGGLGRSLGRWLADHGAKNLLMLSRNAVSSPHAQSFHKLMEDMGVHLVLANCDIADRMSLQRVLDEAAETLPPVRGVIHGGAVFQDTILESMTEAQWDTSLAPKVAGTWNLHQAFSAADSLDFFLVLSSLVGVIGNPSQANYTAGGAFQDAVARHRSARGLPCVTVDLGLVTDLGYLADAGRRDISDRLETTGQFRVIREPDLHRLIDYGVRAPRRPARTAQVVTGLASGAVRKKRLPWTRELRFAALAEDDDRLPGGGAGGRQESGGPVAANLAQSLAEAQDADEAAELVEKAVMAKLADMFARPTEDIDAARPLAAYGVDSLVAVEIRNWLVLTARCDMSIFDLLGARSLRDLASTIGRRSKMASTA